MLPSRVGNERNEDLRPPRNKQTILPVAPVSAVYDHPQFTSIYQTIICYLRLAIGYSFQVSPCPPVPVRDLFQI